MSPITTLQWNDDIAYAPRGTRYELKREHEAYVVWRYNMGDVAGVKIGASATRDGAMTVAQGDVVALTERIAREEEIVPR